MKPMRVTLPWPGKLLSPNARAHYMTVARAKKKFKEASWALTKQAGLVIPADARPQVQLTFYPPTVRRRDEDNLVAMMKSLLDGVALACGCDDSQWHLKEPIVAGHIGGYVVVEFTLEEPANGAA